MSFHAPYPSSKPIPKGEWEKRRINMAKSSTERVLRWVSMVGVGLILLTSSFGAVMMLRRGAQFRATAPSHLSSASTGPIAKSASGAASGAVKVASPVTPLTAPTARAQASAATSKTNPAANPVTIPAGFEARPAPNAPKDQPVPLFGPGFDPSDGKPTYVCGTYPDSSYTLLDMQMSGRDVAHGFHLGIVPMGMSGPYNMSEESHVNYMVDGTWDCMVERMDENAGQSMGLITAIVDESAGSLGIYARGDLKTYEDLGGKRVGFVNDTSSHFFLLYTLAIMPLESQKTVQMQGFDTIDQAIAAFNDGKLDALSGWQPYLSQTEARGGKPVLTSEQLRIIVRSIITSRKAIAAKPGLVQAFHDAWFDTLSAQLSDVDAAAKQIAAWGHNDWTSIGRDKAVTQFRDILKESAQATLKQNESIAANASPIVNILQSSRDFWLKEQASNNQPKPDSLPLVKTLFDFSYVLQTAKQLPGLETTAKPINATFSLYADPSAHSAPAVVSAATPVPAAPVVPASPALGAPITTTVADVARTVAVLPCRKFTFLPSSAELTADSIRVLNVCVLPALQQRGTVSLIVKGSAAWPGPSGTYTKDQIASFGRARAQAIIDYLVSQQIDPARLMIESTLPPKDNWDTLDLAKQSEDRWVEMTLVESGW